MEYVHLLSLGRSTHEDGLAFGGGGRSKCLLRRYLDPLGMLGLRSQASHYKRPPAIFLQFYKGYLHNEIDSRRKPPTCGT